MRIFRNVVVAGSIAVSTGLLAQSPANEAAAAVLAATREALGGEKKLAAVKSLVATGRTRQVRGENLVPIEFEIAMELPDRYVRKDEIPAQESGPTTVGFNGAELIQFPAPTPPTMPGRAGGPPTPTPEQAEAGRRMRLAGVKQDVLRLILGMSAGAFPRASPLSFSYVAKAEAPQGKADVLAVTGPDNFSARFFVNTETHLPIMITWTASAGPQRGGPGQRGGPSRGDMPATPERGPAPERGGGPATPERGATPPREGGPGTPQPPARGETPPASAGQPPSRGESAPASAGPAAPAAPPESRLYFSDYREVGGLQFPFRLRRALGPDTTEETTFDGFKVNPKIEAKKFEVRK
jgi:hypothetical protein